MNYRMEERLIAYKGDCIDLAKLDSFGGLHFFEGLKIASGIKQREHSLPKISFSPVDDGVVHPAKDLKVVDCDTISSSLA